MTNLRWRKALRDEAAKHEPIRRALLTACSQSCLFWMNAFGWTYRLRKVEGGMVVPCKPSEANYPMITWPVQDEIVDVFNESIDDGEDVNGDKSRDMGLSWLMLYVFDWRFLFKREQHFGLVSRKEEEVDERGEMDSLFEKIRYINNMVPHWMKPQIVSRHMHLRNTEMNSSISGESTNTNVGRGGRKTAYGVDEAAAIPNAEMVESSLSQTTGCQIWISTALGPNTAFHKRIKEKRGRYVSAPWYRHPEKAEGAHQIRDEMGAIKWTSPWYEKLPEKMSMKAIAQEVDMDHGQAGEMFFGSMEIERHRQDHQERPLFSGDLIDVDEMTERETIEAMHQMDASRFLFIVGSGRSPWRFWIDLEELRPPQEGQYVFGIDISNGSGSSNSVISVIDNATGRFVAKWWDAYTSPEDLAVVAARAGIWFGGVSAPAFIVWENNGPGGIFGRKLIKIGYPNFYMQRVEGSKRNAKTTRYGWHSDKAKKEILLGLYRDAIATSAVMQHCEESLDEALDYIYDDTTGVLIPSQLREESSGGRELHGDHVIADALCVLGREELPRHRNSVRRAPKGSFELRRRAYRERRKKESDAWS